MSIVPILASNKGSSQRENPDNFIEPILVMGQSNVDHRAPQASLPVGVPIVSDGRVLIYQNGDWRNFDCSGTMESSLQEVTSFSWDVVYLHQLADYLGKSVYVTKLSMGGTAFKSIVSTTPKTGDWNINSNEKYDLYPIFLQYIVSVPFVSSANSSS